jgi:hypothetical protein
VIKLLNQNVVSEAEMISLLQAELADEKKRSEELEKQLRDLALIVQLQNSELERYRKGLPPAKPNNDLDDL